MAQKLSHFDDRVNIPRSLYFSSREKPIKENKLERVLRGTNRCLGICKNKERCRKQIYGLYCGTHVDKINCEYKDCTNLIFAHLKNPCPIHESPSYSCCKLKYCQQHYFSLECCQALLLDGTSCQRETSGWDQLYCKDHQQTLTYQPDSTVNSLVTSISKFASGSYGSSNVNDLLKIMVTHLLKTQNPNQVYSNITNMIMTIVLLYDDCSYYLLSELVDSFILCIKKGYGLEGYGLSGLDLDSNQDFHTKRYQTENKLVESIISSTYRLNRSFDSIILTNFWKTENPNNSSKQNPVDFFYKWDWLMGDSLKYTKHNLITLNQYLIDNSYKKNLAKLNQIIYDSTNLCKDLVGLIDSYF